MIEPVHDKKQRYIDGVVMFLLMGNTANPFFYRSVEMLSLSFIILLILYWFKKGRDKVRFNKYLYIYITAIIVLQAAQTAVYHIFPLKTFLGEYLRIAFAILSMTLLGQRFFDRFIQFVSVFAVISFFFYFPALLIRSFGPFMVDHVAKYTLAPFVNNYDGLYVNRENIIIFNFTQIDIHRNSGFYWEPGTHGGMLLIALFLNLFYRKQPLFSKYNIVFFVAILTTLSTTTYLAVFFVVLVYLKEFFLRRPALSVFILLALAATSALLYNKLEFLNKKIDKQIEYTHKGVPGESRFNSFLADMRELKDHPLIGAGRNMEMKFGKNYFNIDAKELHRNNGLGVLLGTYGILFFCIWIWLLYRSFYSVVQNRINALMGVVLILIIGFSEDYFFKVFFIALVTYCGLTFVPAGVRKKSWKMQLGI